jgi:hypothetical protein
MQNQESPLSSNADRKIPRVNRRKVLKYLGSSALVAALPPAFIEPTVRSAASHEPAAAASSPINPKWYGFNLLEYFSTDPDWMKYFPYRNDGMFLEDDFRWIRDWGFNWVRLPMDYRFWTDPKDLLKIHEDKIEPIDRAIRLGDKYAVHVTWVLHPRHHGRGIHRYPRNTGEDQRIHGRFDTGSLRAPMGLLCQALQGDPVRKAKFQSG